MKTCLIISSVSTGSMERIVAVQVQNFVKRDVVFDHFGTFVLSVNVKIGSNCNIVHNVTIRAARGHREGAPKIGNKVWIDSGAVIVGNIEIGSDVLIVPNSFVNFDVPSDSLVIGNPAMIKHKNNPTKYYINNVWPD